MADNDEAVYRGTTPTLAIDADADLTGYTVHIYLMNNGSIFDLTPAGIAPADTGCIVTVALTQDQTLQLDARYPLFVQLRAKQGEQVVASDVAQLQVEDIIKDGEL